MGLLSGLVVTAARPAITRGFTKAATQAAVPAITSGIVRGAAGGGVPNLRPDPSTPPTRPPPPPPQEVAPIEVTAPSSMGAAGAGAAAGGALAPLAQAALSALPQAAGHQLAGLDVTARQQPAAPPALANIDPSLGAVVEGIDVVAPGGANPALTPIQEQVSGQETIERQQPFSAEDMMLLGAGGLSLAGLMGGGGGGGGGNGATDWVKNHWKEILAGGAIIGGLGSQSGGGGGGAQAGLEGLADTSRGYIDRLGQMAEAGFQGNIGGRGLNSINRMVKQAQAAIRQRYAAMGMSGSTAEADDLNAASQKGVDLQFEVGQKMAQTGLQAIAGLTGQSAAIYTQLLNAATAKNTSLGNALANFAAAVAT